MLTMIECANVRCVRHKRAPCETAELVWAQVTEYWIGMHIGATWRIR